MSDDDAADMEPAMKPPQRGKASTGGWADLFDDTPAGKNFQGTAAGKASPAAGKGSLSALQAKAAKMTNGRPTTRKNEKLEAAIQKRGTLSAEEIRAKYSAPRRSGTEEEEEEEEEKEGGKKAVANKRITSPVRDKKKDKTKKENSKSAVNIFQSSIDDPPHKRKVLLLFFTMNVLFSIMVATTGALGIEYATVNTYNAAFLGFYMVLLAFVLVLYEIAQLSDKFERLDSFLLKNVGFLYGPMGKSAYLLFMAILSFGIESPRELAMATGVLVILWCIFQCGLSWKFPDFFHYKEKYVPEVVEGEVMDA